MTTALAPTAVETATALLAEVQQARAKRLDPLDIPRTLTQRQVNAYVTVTARFGANITDLGSTLARLEAATARRAAMLPARERLQKAEATLLSQLATAAKWRELPPGPAQDNAYNQCEALKAAILVLRRGGVTRDGEHVNGLPGPLAALLTDRCVHCGHAVVFWPGPLDSLDEEIKELEKAIAADTTRLTHYLIPDARALLTLAAETTTAATP
ncbi:MAG TPA: hypothetical protein VMU73_04285 [Gaiellaceae bacterium]|nr:hypothetical protein [Gaiellaceae bacterium]